MSLGRKEETGMKNKNFWESIKCALRGLGDAYKAERNFKIYTGIGLAFLIFNVLLSASVYDYVFFIILAAGVFTAEYINTALERVIDRMGDGINEDFRFAKDVAAAAVLVSGIAFFAGEGLLLISKLV